MTIYVVIAYMSRGGPGHNIKKVTTNLNEAETTRDKLRGCGWDNVEVYDYFLGYNEVSNI